MYDPQFQPDAAGPPPSRGLSRNAWIVIAGALAVIILAIVMVLISNSGGGSASGPSDAQQAQTAAQGFLASAGSTDGTGGSGGASGPVGGRYACADADKDQLDSVGPYLGKIRLKGAPAVTGSKATISGTAVFYGQTFPVHVLLSKEQGTWCVTTVTGR